MSTSPQVDPMITEFLRLKASVARLELSKCELVEPQIVPAKSVVSDSCEVNSDNSMTCYGNTSPNQIKWRCPNSTDWELHSNVAGTKKWCTAVPKEAR